MKKAITFFLVLELFIMLVSCQNTQPPNTLNTESNTPIITNNALSSSENSSSKDNTTESNKPITPETSFSNINAVESNESISTEISSPSKGEIPLLTIEAYKDYQKFIASNTLPPNFIYYESINQIGNFKAFICLSDARYGDYSHYMYSLVDETGLRMTLYIEDKDRPGDSSLEPITMVNTTDMRALDTNIHGVYMHENIQYTYISGKLISISWENNDLRYIISGPSMFSVYPTDAPTFVGRLLNLTTATDTIESFLSSSIE